VVKGGGESGANRDAPGALILVTYARRPATRTHDHHVGNRKRRFLFRDPALDVALRVGTHVLLHHHHVLHQQLAFAGKDAQHASLLAFVATGNHFHLVIALDVDSCMHCQPSATSSQPSDCFLFPGSPHKTSGARETIFKNFFSRSSRATGPNTRVPTGSPASLMRTAAF